MNNDYKGEIIIYQTEDGLSNIDVKIENAFLGSNGRFVSKR